MVTAQLPKRGAPKSDVWNGRVRCVRRRAVHACATCCIVASLAKTPGAVHCFGGWCHRVNTVDEMDGMVGRRGMLLASYYDDCRRDRFNPCGLTSSGAVFRPDLADNAASPIFPDGTVLLLYNHKTKLAAVVRVTNAGPYRGDRKLDVSRATAERLGFRSRGVAELEVVVVQPPDLAEARYSKHRTYPPVPGFIGRFASFDDAHDAAIGRLKLETPAVRVAAANAQAGDTDHVRQAHSRTPLTAAKRVDLSLVAPAHRVVRDRGTDVIALAGPTDDIATVPVTELQMPDEALPSLTDHIAAFIAATRAAARLHRAPDVPLQLAEEADAAGQSLLDRARDFIRVAQQRARFGAGDGPIYSENTAIGQPAS
ncbi:MAG: hypothetical protein IPL91_08965 [Hyphomicrobium sp.]|nr:hypothetical protein [Hyphomicrobium sp.]